jgi:hypothetical protein
VGVFRDPPVFLAPGDEIVVELENLMLLRNRIAVRPPDAADP